MSSPNEATEHVDDQHSRPDGIPGPLVPAHSTPHRNNPFLLHPWLNRLPPSWRASRSIRNELILAQLLFLFVIVTGFGGAIYALVSHGTYRQVESDLLGAAQLLANDPNIQHEIASLSIAQVYRRRFGPAPRDYAYFGIWDKQGRLIGGSDPLPPHTRPLDHAPRTDGPRPFFSRTHGSHLEVIVAGPAGTQILVGRPLARENDGLRRLLFWDCAFGLLSMIVGGIGAWWLARRIAEPLEQMTNTAEQITYRHLDQRLPTESSSNEVTRLTNVFNQMLERLQLSFRQQNQFTADASHELRTPVAIILAQAEHSLSRPRNPDEYRNALQTCLDAANRMKRLIDDLLILARADLGCLQLRRNPIDLAEVVRPVIAMLEPLARERQIRISSQLLTAWVDGDATRLGQVITNLVTNAIRYNRAEGDVFVSVFARDQQCCLVVADSGLGISLADQDRVFERFYRADAARTFDDNQGTGLGLSIAQEIVTAHSGTLEISSQPDRGTTVTARFPLISGPVPGAESINRP
ncbi:sensor histidine kinase [Schlesneria paludicola]|uniref:sensor histidine kinase n=1 Tax=Schlesneria paludicola TaxID=360056 RepID=UPI00029A89C3|nr:ATP-binding protein [Schlesneria paludicola]